MAQTQPHKYNSWFEANLWSVWDEFLEELGIDWGTPMMFTGWSEIYNQKILQLTKFENLFRKYRKTPVILSNAITYSHDKKKCTFEEYLQEDMHMLNLPIDMTTWKHIWEQQLHGAPRWWNGGNGNSTTTAEDGDGDAEELQQVDPNAIYNWRGV